jgi:hypothetical protein
MVNTAGIAIMQFLLGERAAADKQFLNPALRGLYLDTAIQMIQFRRPRGVTFPSCASATSSPPWLCEPQAELFHVASTRAEE